LELTLGNITVSPNLVMFGTPFNVSWAVVSLYGSDAHNATLSFVGQNTTGTYPNSGGWKMLQITDPSATNPALTLSVTDSQNPFATLDTTISFARA
jgi:hypothetical protein